MIADLAPASYGHFCGSASCYGRPENIVVFPVVIGELELGNVERKVFGTDLMIGAHDASLDEAPEPFNSLCVNGTHNVLAEGMIHRPVREFLLNATITPPLVSAKQADLFGQGIVQEAVQGGRVGAVDDACDYRTFVLYCPGNNQLAARPALASPLVFVPVFGLAPDEGFVGFDNAHELAELRINQPGPDPHAEIVSGTVRAETHNALHFKSGNAFLTGQHHVYDSEPVAQADVGILKNGANKDREAVAARLDALCALPMKRPVSERIDLFIATTGTFDANRPAPGLQIRLAGIAIREHVLELFDGHLGGELGHSGGSIV